MSELRRLAAEGRIGVGTTIRIRRTFSGEEVQAFGDLTRDYNPVHYEPRWAAQKGFVGPICHGLLVGGMICEAGGQWGWLASGMSFRFRAPVYPGDTVSCEMTVVAVDERQRARAEFVLTNQRGDVVVTGELWGHLPSSQDQDLLRTMLSEGDPTNLLRDERPPAEDAFTCSRRPGQP